MRKARHVEWPTVQLSALVLVSTEVENSNLDLGNFTEWCEDKPEHLVVLTFYYQHIRGSWLSLSIFNILQFLPSQFSQQTPALWEAITLFKHQSMRGLLLRLDVHVCNFKKYSWPYGHWNFIIEHSVTARQSRIDIPQDKKWSIVAYDTFWILWFYFLLSWFFPWVRVGVTVLTSYNFWNNYSFWNGTSLNCDTFASYLNKVQWKLCSFFTMLTVTQNLYLYWFKKQEN